MEYGLSNFQNLLAEANKLTELVKSDGKCLYSCNYL